MKITIAGDSWGCGEWQPLSSWDLNLASEKNTENLKKHFKGTDGIYGVSHTGLQSYLEKDGHIVTNVSRGAGTNQNVLKDLPRDKQDLIFVFVTDSAREYSDRNKFWKLDYTFEDYVNRHKKSIKKFIQSLDQLDIGPIYLIGGLSKLSNDLVKGTSISIAVPSMLELVIPGSTQFEFYFEKHIGGDLLYTKGDISSKMSKTLLNKLYEEHSIWEQYRNHSMLINDHPTKEAHKILFNQLHNYEKNG
tara:strand:- start:3649 stop:4389 length:741 start_codon:yes stop_codon:yes gene_type:complete